VHGIPRAGVRELEIEQRPGRKRRAGPFESDARSGEPTEIVHTPSSSTVGGLSAID